MLSQKYPARDHLFIRDKADSFYDSQTFERYHMPKEQVDALFALDGKTPLSKAWPQYTNQERKRLLKSFDENGFLGERERHWREGLNVHWTIFRNYNPRQLRKQSKVGLLYSRFLEWVTIPLLLITITILTFSGHSTNYHLDSVASIVSSLLLGAGLGVALHEFSHSIVARTYGASTLEVGLIFPLIPGGYIVINEASIKDRPFKRLLVLGAGIECNALLGVLLLSIGALVSDTLAPIFHVACMINVLFMINILPFASLDGGQAIRLLSEIDSNAKNVYNLSAVISAPILVYVLTTFFRNYWYLTGWNNVILTLYASVALVASLSFYVTTWFVRARQKDLKAN